MGDTKGGRCPAHAAYGLAVALALALGFAAGWLANTPRDPLPERFGTRFTQVEENTKTMINYQRTLMERLPPDRGSRDD